MNNTMKNWRQELILTDEIRLERMEIDCILIQRMKSEIQDVPSVVDGRSTTGEISLMRSVVIVDEKK